MEKLFWQAKASTVRMCGTTETHFAGCSKRPFSKAAASEEARRTLRYVEPLSEARTKLTDFFSILPGIADYQCRYPLMISSILFRINGMEARRMTGRQQLHIGTDDGQPQGLEFHSQRQMQDLW